MKVIFLDVDGVLNSMDYLEENYEDYRLHPINRICVERLARIVRQTDARLVLSSSWRTGWSPDEEKIMPACKILTDVLKEYGFKGGGSIETPSYKNTTLIEYIESIFGNISLLKRDKGYYIYQAIKMGE